MTVREFDRNLLANLGVPVRNLVTDSRAVQPGDVFLAYPGGRFDGRRFIAQSIERGAAAVLWEADDFAWRAEWRVPNLAVAGLREQAGAIAAHIYGQPSRELWMAGVTGTNGKTSCSHWIAQSLQRCGRPTAVIGTLGNGFPDALDAATHTTPDAVSLQQQLRRYRDAGAQAVAMEVSSHALDQGRVNGTKFDTALFTNLTRDHLDYHGDMESYGAAKAKLFRWPGLANAVINLDDSFGRELALGLRGASTRVLGYGIGRGEIAGHRVDLSTRGLRLEIRTPWGEAELSSRLIGGFNVSNLLGTLGVLLTANLKLDDAVAALAQVAPVAGRLEMIREPGHPLVVVDYAHTPDALEKVLETLREIVGHDRGARLICVFGCGGDRDPGKRPIMGEVATRLADLVIVTSDNPRSEDPRAIVDQVVAGAHANHEIEVDRASAIARAIAEAREGDVVLVAGKGHESYQEVDGTRLPFSDVEVARKALQRDAGGKDGHVQAR
ncbi:MAG: UDP-N-acetylmuramoyl-L-alanyl-D-glutamate--2,6-diaminopimelate ligase [Burkholderiales bacterium]|nr:UDP-N-acetylmuramoyl-L-alanyl-D-glutamate--2,6-diaminopimelate ligase [Burkholderiales bacterium]